MSNYNLNLLLKSRSYNNAINSLIDEIDVMIKERLSIESEIDYSKKVIRYYHLINSFIDIENPTIEKVYIFVIDLEACTIYMLKNIDELSSDLAYSKFLYLSKLENKKKLYSKIYRIIHMKALGDMISELENRILSIICMDDDKLNIFGENCKENMLYIKHLLDETFSTNFNIC